MANRDYSVPEDRVRAPEFRDKTEVFSSVGQAWTSHLTRACGVNGQHVSFPSSGCRFESDQALRSHTDEP